MKLNGHSSLQNSALHTNEMLKSTPILSVENLTIEFGKGAEAQKVVDNLSFSLESNKTLAIVGESGSGKSISSLAVLGLLKHLGASVTSGSIQFESKIHNSRVDLTALQESALRLIRGNEIAMIFQEPMTSLNPVYTVGTQIIETLMLHQHASFQKARAEALRLIDLVRLPNAIRILNCYPHQLSGGQRQRIMIAIALSCRPKILIADEPTTALDVTVQAQILQIIKDLQAELKNSVIFISHDMGVVSEMADEILIMRSARKVEADKAHVIFNRPKADYTKALLAAVPKIGSMKGKPNPDFFHISPDNSAKKPINGAVSVPDYRKPLLQVKDLTTHYSVRGGFLKRVTHKIHAVQGVSLEIYPGETLALVGESGSGKSTIGKTIQQLVNPESGQIHFKGQDVLSLSKSARKTFLRNIQYVFQDPFGSLNPRKDVRTSIIEPAITHGLISDKNAITKRVEELLLKVGLNPEHANRFPHEFSGGQRQRICIARALSCQPKLIIADEAVSALDVTVQAQVLNLLMTLQAQAGLAYLFITHDMAVVERVSHRVAVMYLGRLVEIGTRQQIFENPQHPYTKKLMNAVPVVDPDRKRERVSLEGEIPNVIHPVGYQPALATFEEITKGHFVATNF